MRISATMVGLALTASGDKEPWALRMYRGEPETTFHILEERHQK
jgi:hypothetical protein